METKAKLSTLWIFMLLNMIFRDIHEMPRMIEEIMTGALDVMQITDELLLLAGILLEIPIAMIILARVLPYRVNRWTNILAAIIIAAFIVANGPNDLDDMWFMAIEVVALVAIVWFSWRWADREARVDHPAKNMAEAKQPS